MAIALVGSVGAFSSVATTTFQPAFGQATTVGHLLVAWYLREVTSGTDPTVNQAWVKADSLAASAGLYGAIYYKKNCAAGETAPTFTVTGGTHGGMLAEFSGASTTAPLDDNNHTDSATSPVVATNAGADAASGDLVLSVGRQSLSKAGTDTSSITFNNGATTTDVDDDDAISALEHHRFSYGITTGNSGADTASLASASMNISTLGVVLASFNIPVVAGLPVEELTVMQAVKRAAHY